MRDQRLQTYRMLVNISSCVLNYDYQMQYNCLIIVTISERRPNTGQDLSVLIINCTPKLKYSATVILFKNYNVKLFKGKTKPVSWKRLIKRKTVV